MHRKKVVLIGLNSYPKPRNGLSVMSNTAHSVNQTSKSTNYLNKH